MKNWLNKLKENAKEGKDMMIKMFAIEVIKGNRTVEQCPKSFQAKIKQYIRDTVEDEEVVKQLIGE